MSAGTVTGYVATREPIVGLGVRPTGKKNLFGEDEGQFVAIGEHDQSGINTRAFLNTLPFDSEMAQDSIAGKLGVLDKLREMGFTPKVNIILKRELASASALTEEAGNVKGLADAFFFGRDEKIQPDELFAGSLRLARVEAASFAERSHNDMKIAYAFYDKIAKLFSYGDGNAVGPNSYLQIIPNGIPLSVDVFRENPPQSPLRPGVTGDLRTTEDFASLASMAFDTNGKEDPKKDVEKAFGLVIGSANATEPPDEKAMEILKKVHDFLWVEVTDPFTGEKTKEKSRDWLGYINSTRKYEEALVAYMSAQLKYDLTKPEDQRQWQIEALLLQGKIDRAKEEMETFKTVRKALNYLKIYGNNAVENALVDAKDRFDKAAVPSIVNNGQKFRPSYCFPANWYDDDSGFSKVSVSTKDFKSNYSHEAKSYGGGVSYGSGWLSVGGSYHRSTSETRHHMEASEFQTDFDIATVSIERNWMDLTFLGLDNWEMGGQPPGKISKGVHPSQDSQIGSRTLPYVSTALVIAKNVKIKGNWSESDERIFKDAISASVSVSWGPFRLGGASYSKTKLERDFHATESDGTFSIPGAQVIGVINTVVPFAAPK